MNYIIAVIRENKLEDVREALIQIDITRVTVSRVSGHGQSDEIDLYRGKRIAPGLTTKVEIRIACNSDFVEPAIKAITQAARTGDGEAGDGKIFVMPISDCIRIRTGERGKEAI